MRTQENNEVIEYLNERNQEIRQKEIQEKQLAELERFEQNIGIIIIPIGE